MKILVVSDTHGQVSDVIRTAKKIKGLRMLYHLGDYATDAQEIARELHLPYQVVKGNCDTGSFESEELLLSVAGRWILLCHGHKYGVKYSYDRVLLRAMERNASAVLFGHTHNRFCEWNGGILMLNPGSPSASWDAHGSVAVLTIDDEHFDAEIIDCLL